MQWKKKEIEEKYYLICQFDMKSYYACIVEQEESYIVEGAAMMNFH